MRYLLVCGVALYAGSLAQSQCVRERAPLFPRLQARLRPQPCVPWCPTVSSRVEPKPEPPKQVDAPPEKFEYVTIRGRVYWPESRAIPPLKIVNNGPAPMPGFGPVLINDLSIEPTNRGVKNVIVWLRPDDTDRTHTFPLDKVKPELRLRGPNPPMHTIAVKDGNFEPRILAARAGDQLRFSNTAPVGINVNYSSDAEAFNVLLQRGAEKKLAKPLEAQRSTIGFACNVHPWLMGRIRVFDHPYFAVTDQDGRFEIRGVPAGRWRIVYQHELGYHTGKNGVPGFAIDVPDDKPARELLPQEYLSPLAE